MGPQSLLELMSDEPAVLLSVTVMWPFQMASRVSPPLHAFPTKTHPFQVGLWLVEQCPNAGGLTAATLSNLLAKWTGHIAPVMEAPIQLLSLAKLG